MWLPENQDEGAPTLKTLEMAKDAILELIDKLNIHIEDYKISLTTENEQDITEALKRLKQLEQRKEIIPPNICIILYTANLKASKPGKIDEAIKLILSIKIEALPIPTISKEVAQIQANNLN